MKADAAGPGLHARAKYHAARAQRTLSGVASADPAYEKAACEADGLFTSIVSRHRHPARETGLSYERKCDDVLQRAEHHIIVKRDNLCVMVVETKAKSSSRDKRDVANNESIMAE